MRSERNHSIVLVSCIGDYDPFVKGRLETWGIVGQTV